MNGAVLALLILAGAVQVQSVAPTLSCDVIINNHTITFPKGWMEFGECNKLANELILKDKTDADIKCVCQTGMPT